MNASEIMSSFRDAMRAEGIETDEELIADGERRRFHVLGDRAGTKNGAYELHADGVPAGWFGTHRGGWITHTWCARTELSMTAEEREAHARRMEDARKSREAEARRRQTETAKKAAAIWKNAKPAPADHPYLQRKGVKPYGLRVATWRKWIRSDAGEWQQIAVGGALLVPLFNEKGELRNLQAIMPGRGLLPEDRDKDFLGGGQKTGCFSLLGEATAGAPLLLCEGFATGASLHESTGHAVAIGIDAGNLKPVALAMRVKHPDARLIVCADNDRATEGNPGIGKGREAAQAAGAALCWPEFGEGTADATDFNDLHQLSGPDAVRQAIERASEAQADGKPTESGSVTLPDSVTAPTATEAPDRPPRFLMDARGLWLCESDRDGNPKRPRFIVEPFDVLALVRTHAGAGWGLLVELRDPDKRRHRVIIPHATLKGEGAEALGLMFERGCVPRMGTDRFLIEYLRETRPDKRARTTERTGWHGDVYVMPDRSIGNDDEPVIFQNESPGANAFKEKGRLDQWRENVSALCIDNSRLVFAVSAAFAAPLLYLAGAESGGIHFRGGSSGGKTTLLRLAGSICGGPDYLQRWRATDNGLEALTLAHCDAPLMLDELAQIDPKAAGEVAYMLGNGTGKTRSDRRGSMRERASWRVLYLSAGEIGLVEHMAEANRKAKAGQEIRLLEIPADAGAGLGCFENLHGHANGAEFARALDSVSRKYHGTAWPAYLDGITRQRDKLPDLLRAVQHRFESEYLTAQAEGQARRAAARFALIAAAGELATKLGLTGWPEGAALQAAATCFRAWLARRPSGEGNSEERSMLAQVRMHFEQHGEARYTDWSRPVAEDNHAAKTLLRCGFRKHEPSSTEWFVFPESFKSEVCKGFDFREVAKLLLRLGHLQGGTEKDRPYTVREDLPGEGRRRVYRVLASILESDDA